MDTLNTDTIIEKLELLEKNPDDMFAKLDIDNLLGTNTALECFKSASPPYTETGLESLSTFSVIGSNELPSGSPQAHPSIRLDNVPYCPVYIVGHNDKGGNSYTANLGGIIENVTDYLDLLECLSTMRDIDDITLVIDSPGGYVHTGVTICTHMLMCQGFIKTLAVGLCASAGSLIWSAGTKCEVDDTALLMWHMSAHSDFGNSVAVASEAELTVRFVKNVLLAASLKKGHITNQEMDDICNIPEYAVYISAEEMRHRLSNTTSEKTV